MGKFKKGDRVKIEVKDESSPIGEWMWMLVEESDDEKRLVFAVPPHTHAPSRRSPRLQSRRPSSWRSPRFPSPSAHESTSECTRVGAFPWSAKR